MIPYSKQFLKGCCKVGCLIKKREFDGIMDPSQEKIKMLQVQYFIGDARKYGHEFLLSVVKEKKKYVIEVNLKDKRSLSFKIRKQICFVVESIHHD
jgi:hypothetical protein